MERREVIKSLAFVSLHALCPSILASFLSSCTTPGAEEREFVFFDLAHQGLVKEMVDLLIPPTSTPSASEVGVHYFLDQVFAHCFSAEQRVLIKEGLGNFITTWTETNDKMSLIKELDEKAYAGDEDAVWYKVIKQYALVGFFTSKEGTTLAGDYQKFPQRFVGEVKVDPNSLAHSRTFLKYYF